MIIRRNANRKHKSIGAVASSYSTGSQVRLLHTNYSLNSELFLNTGGAMFSISSLSGCLEVTGQIQVVKRPQTATEWVERNMNKLGRHAGMYVAITGTGLVATSESFGEVYTKAKSKGVMNPLVFKVPKPTTHGRFVSVKSI